jgi:hypothetical protein
VIPANGDKLPANGGKPTTKSPRHQEMNILESLVSGALVVVFS